MVRYRILTFLFIGIIFAIPTTGCSHSSAEPPTTIIFDLHGVLFKEDTAILRQKIGIGTLASYALTHWKNPSTVCFDLLEKMSTYDEHQPPTLLKFKKKIMPRCIVEWQQGQKTCDEVRTELVNFIQQIAQQNYFSSEQEKELIQHIIQLIFDAQELTTITKPHLPMIKLAKQLKEAGYKLFLLANVPTELYKTIQTDYPEIFELFDGGIVSCQTHLLKPDKLIFQTLLDTYQLQPQECILIDERKENVSAAQEFAIRGITYQKTPLAIKKLKELGVSI